MSGKVLFIVLSLISISAWAQEDLNSASLVKRSLVFYEDVKENDATMKAIEATGGAFKLDLINSKTMYLELAKFQYENGQIENLLILNSKNGIRTRPVSVVHLKTKFIPSLWTHSDGIYLGFKFETGWGAKVNITGTKIALEEYNE